MLDFARVEERLAESVLSRCDALALCTEREGSILRTFLSPAMAECRHLVRGWMEEAGMLVNVDRAGNLHGYYPGATQDAPRLMIASHLDTVPDAGRYDGVLGVMLGVALVEALHGTRLAFAIEVIGVSDEEGVRFGIPFLGSRALLGALTAEDLAKNDADNISLDSLLTAFAADHPEATQSALHPGTRAYLEFHIEQGPLLEKLDAPLAVVDAIAGQSRGTMTFTGRTGHAGTTPMPLRQDALTAAAEWLLAVEALAAATPGLVATTGRMHCAPNVANSIAGAVSCSLDVRSPADGIRRDAVQAMIATAHAIATRRNLECAWTMHADQPSVALDASLTQWAEQALIDAGCAPVHMSSGAGHDAMMLAPHLPTAMIFLRSPGGISHHPDEAVLAADVAAALRAGLNFLESLPYWLESRCEPCNT